MKEYGQDSWWYYFDRVYQTTKASCKNCEKIIEQGQERGTNKLKNHLKNHHRDLYEQREKAKSEIEQLKKVKGEKPSFDRTIPQLVQGFIKKI